MHDDYLWSGRGTPDPEIERLEHALSRYCSSPRPLASARRRTWRLPVAVAAAAASIAAAWWIAAVPVSHWRLEMDGSRRTLSVGETVEPARGPARIDSDRVGLLRLEPGSRLHMLRSRHDQERFRLDRGTMRAFIWAPPTRFVVDTPSAVTVDLGCEYELHVAEDGNGLLTVLHGWVAFQAGAVESFIPAGAMCRTFAGRGPGLPHYEDAPAAFRAALAAFERNGAADAVDGMLAAARERDALTLWHLLLRVPPADRARVAGRFAELIPGVDAARLARADAASVEAAWDALGLGAAEWWRTWKRNW